MGRKSAHYNKIYKNSQKRLQLTVPKALREALEAQGVEVPKSGKGRSFYSKLGLQMDPNADVKSKLGFTDKLGEIRKQQRTPEPEIEGNPQAFQDAVDSLPQGMIYQKHLTDYELRCAMQLRAYYGDDYEMMSYDFRRNPMQWSVGEIRKIMTIYEREASLLASKKDELEGGEAAPEEDEE